ncbi:MAG: hypothetical protein WKG00_10785 [Polyangiaceae bacterium]
MAVALLLSACGAADGTGDVSEEGALLFGMSEAEITELLPLASKPYTLEAWLDRHRGAFDCATYGTLCAHVGPEAAYSITEDSYRLGLEGATRDEINDFVDAAVEAASATWQAEGPEEHDDERASVEAFDQGGTSSERVKVKVWADIPGAGDPYIQVQCTFQTKTLGIWGGQQTADMHAGVNGHMHDSAGGPNYEDIGDNETVPFPSHSFQTEKVYLQPQSSNDDVHGFGHCQADRSSSGFHGWIETNVVGN